MTTSTRPNARTTAACCGALLAVAALAGCSGDADATTDSLANAPAAPESGKTLFADPFADDHNGWALPENEAARSVMRGGDFIWISKQPGLRPHLIAKTVGDAFDRGQLHMRNVVVDASVTPVRGKAAMGPFCREVRDTDADFQWYEFVVRDGYAAIRRADSSGHLDVLAKTTDVDVPLGDKASLEAACVDGAQGQARLWLSVNGTPTLFARDTHALGNGAAGLQAYDAPSGTRMIVRWHDFTVSQPAAD
jgi:hypothetical protein